MEKNGQHVDKLAANPELMGQITGRKLAETAINQYESYIYNGMRVLTGAAGELPFIAQRQLIEPWDMPEEQQMWSEIVPPRPRVPQSPPLEIRIKDESIMIIHGVGIRLDCRDDFYIFNRLATADGSVLLHDLTQDLSPYMSEAVAWHTAQRIIDELAELMGEGILVQEKDENGVLVSARLSDNVYFLDLRTPQEPDLLPFGQAPKRPIQPGAWRSADFIMQETGLPPRLVYGFIAKNRHRLGNADFPASYRRAGIETFSPGFVDWVIASLELAKQKAAQKHADS